MTSPPTELVDDVGPRAAVRRAQRLRPVWLRVVDADVGAERAREVEFFPRTCRGDDRLGAGALRELDEKRAHSAGRGADEDGLAGGRNLLRQIERGEPLNHQGRRRFEGERVRQRNEDARVDDDVIRIAAGHGARRKERRGDAHADRESADAILAQTLDGSGDLHARNGREFGRHRIAVLSQERLGEIDPRSANANERLSATGLRRGRLDDLQNLGSAEATELNLPHHVSRRC